jgi:drug/metabolite transporter (DMT)-like permease
MLTARRSSEKAIVSRIDGMTMVWLQQAVALPFIVVSLFFAPFYAPSHMSSNFWFLMVQYVLFGIADLFCYFRAIQLAEITYIAPLLTLVAVANIFGSFVVLGQVPTFAGIIGAVLIVAGAFMLNASKRKSSTSLAKKDMSKALKFIVALVILRGYYSNIEVLMLRETNPTTYNFYSSIGTVSAALVLTLVIKLGMARKTKTKTKTVQKNVVRKYCIDTKNLIRSNYKVLAFIGFTYTLNLTATYAAKIIAPTAGYVGAVKSAQVLPMMLIGVLFFKERVTRPQLAAVGVMCSGLVLLALS